MDSIKTVKQKMKRLQFFFGVTALALSIFSGVSFATVYEFQDDGNVVVFEARDYLSKAHLPKIGHAIFTPVKKKTYNRIIESASKKYKLDQKLIHAVIYVESAYQPNALSPKGAQGLMQLMPGTAKRYGVSDAFDPDQNISGGTQYLRDLLDRYDGNRTLALAAYNAGENAVSKYNGVPPYEETINYIEKVETALRSF
jgi:soluble lytic murein transglycosylase-like protein